MKKRKNCFAYLCSLLLCLLLTGCASAPLDVFRDETMDFASIKTVAVLPFANLSKDQLAGERVRDVFNTLLLASGAIYVLPPGEVARGTLSTAIVSPSNPSVDDAMKLSKALKADALITGLVREYGEVRSGTASADVISLSLQLMEAQTGRVVWSASTTQGGIGWLDRLFGGGGQPLNKVTEKAVNDLVNKLFQ